jgi:hypothetical protein
MQDGVFIEGRYALKLGGWIFMIISWSFIIGMLIFCYSRIFRQGIDGKEAKTLKRLKK